MISGVRERVSLAPYASFKVGGIARYFAEPQSETELYLILDWVESEKLSLYIFGKGSNLVISDNGYNGLMLYTGGLSTLVWNGNQVECGAGVLMYTVMRQSVQRGLAGIQKLGGIPGTLGGCVFINAGAYGQETSDVVHSVKSVTRQGTVKIRSAKECHFRYRESLFCELEEIIIGVALTLENAPDPKVLEKEMRESLAHRKDTQPLHLPNSGSIFKRPKGKFPGQVIEAAGLKGLSIGGAEVSTKHANFIVNNGEAKAQDIYDLSMLVKKRVLESQQVELEHEVRFVGEFLPWPR